MRHTTAISLLLMGLGGVARAGGQAGTIGVGIEQSIPGTEEAGIGSTELLTGNTALSLNFDAGKFHVGGFFGYRDPRGAFNTNFVIGGRFYFHIHSTAMSDFSFGGQLGIGYHPNGAAPPNGYDTDVYLEPTFQIRAFIASNVALSFTGGFIVGAADARGFEFGGQASAVAGIHYYFF